MKPVFEKVSPLGGLPFLFKERIEGNFGFNWHFHPEFELTWIVRSHGKRFVGDSIEPYAAGDLVLLGADLPHTWASDKSARRGARSNHAVYAQFRPTFMGETFLESAELAPIAKLLERSAQGLVFSGRTQGEVVGRMERMISGRGMRRVVLLLECLEVLAAAPPREVRALSSKGFAASRRYEEHRIDAVCRFINERYTQPIGQPEAAARAHLSVSAFSRFFRRALGKTFTAYVNELRVGHACRLLIESDRGISQIAYESGFENLSNFNRRFRELKGVSPREYRKQFIA